MAEADWSEMTGVVTDSIVKRGPNRSIPRPPGGGDFVYAVNTVAVPGSGGAYARFYSNDPAFAPVAGGESSSITQVLKRGTSSGTTGWSIWMFVGADTTSVDTRAYALGLSDAEVSHIVLKKCDAAYSPAGLLSAGLPDLEPDPTANGILMRSTNTIAIDTWVHLKLDSIVQPTGDVLLQVFQNDLDVNPIGTPAVWLPIPGMEGPQTAAVDGAIDGYIDDFNQIQTGTPPIPSGRLGYGASFTDTTRRAYFDGGISVTRNS